MLTTYLIVRAMSVTERYGQKMSRGSGAMCDAQVAVLSLSDVAAAAEGM